MLPSPRRGYGPRADSERATTSVIAVVLLVGLTVVLVSAVGGAALGLTSDVGNDVAPTVSLDLVVEGERLVFTHVAGDPVDARTLRLEISVDGTTLTRQPPVPFFAARGFRSGPTGPFNAATDPTWTAGETAALAVASTNDPQIEPGSQIDVGVYAEGMLLARLSATAAGSEEDSHGGDRRHSSGTRATVVMARGLPGVAR